MADAISIQELIDARTDAKTLEEAVNGDAVTTVLSRLGETYPTLSNALNQIDSKLDSADAQVKQGITNLFENGGLPATPFKTKALMTASALANDKYAMVTDDTVNNGLYVKTAGAWVKSTYDPLTQAKAHTNDKVNHVDDDISRWLLAGVRESNNMLDGVPLTLDRFINNSGGVETLAGYRYTDYISVVGGEEYTISRAGQQAGAYYDASRNLIKGIETNAGSGAVTNYKFTTPLNCKFVRVNLTSLDLTPKLIRGDASGRPVNLSPLVLYAGVKELLETGTLGSVNLLAQDGVTYTAGKYLKNDGTETPFASYNYSSYIAVSPDTEYVFSRAGEYSGIFYDSNKVMIKALSTAYIGNGTILDYKEISPSNAAYIRLNVASSSMSIIYFKAVVTGININDYIDPTSIDLQPTSNWSGKTVAWYGTSIPAGQPHQNNQDVYSYANLAVHDLGGRIINKAIGGGGITTKVSGGLSFTTAGGSYYVTDLINLFGTADEPDLVVFDYGVNDRAQFPDDFASIDLSSSEVIESRNPAEFIGAYNKVIDAMLTVKPDVKFCFITHYSDDHPTKPKGANAKMNKMIEACADYWQAPVLRLHTKLGIRNRNGFNNFSIFMPDDVHPASGDGRLTQSMRAACRDFLISIG